jgi:Zn-dependent peptidase ImmA (M78 family)
MSSLTHIRALAEEYATKYNPEHLAPFPYENILSVHADLAVYFTDLDDDDVSGVTLFKDGAYSILINSRKPATRQHFSLGHELGHYFLHKEALQNSRGIIDGDETLDGPHFLYRRDSDSRDLKQEVEANNFAASLIMPADLVRQAWEATTDVEECARIFNVSIVAMSVRLVILGLVSE